MEGTTHQHVHARQMAMGRLAPVLLQDVVLEPVFSVAAARSDLRSSKKPAKIFVQTRFIE